MHSRQESKHTVNKTTVYALGSVYIIRFMLWKRSMHSHQETNIWTEWEHCVCTKFSVYHRSYPLKEINEFTSRNQCIHWKKPLCMIECISSNEFYQRNQWIHIKRPIYTPKYSTAYALVPIHIMKGSAIELGERDHCVCIRFSVYYRMYTLKEINEFL